MLNNKYKKEICLYWKNGKCRKESKDCSFAHGKNDIMNEDCLNGIRCYNENCKFNHPEEWDPLNNKKECNFCIKGFCNKENKKFKHINVKCDNEIIEINKNKNKEFIFNENDFPELDKNSVNKKCLDINEDIFEIKKKLYQNYKLLSSTTDWSEDFEIDNNIKELNNKYKELKQNIYKQNEEIFNNDLNLNIFDFESDIENEELGYKNTPNIEISINGININDSTEKDIQDINKDEILILLNKLEKTNIKMILEIKKLLDYKYKNNENILKYKYQLNKTISDIYLLKNNYNDYFY